METKITHKRGVYSESIVSKLKDGEVFYDTTGEHGIWMGNEDSSGQVQVKQIAGNGESPSPVGSVEWGAIEGSLDNQADLKETLDDIRTIAEKGAAASDALAGHTVAVDVPSDAKFTDTVYDDSSLTGRVEVLENKEELFEVGTGEGSVQIKGASNHANGDNSVVLGCECNTIKDDVMENSGLYALATGFRTDALGPASIATGCYTHTNNAGEFAGGRGNISNYASSNFGDAGNTIYSIGIGGSDIPDHKNAVEVMQNGDTYMIGVGGYDGTNISDAQTVQSVIAAGGSSAATTYHSSVYFGTADLRTNPTCDGSELVDLIRADVNAGKMAILKAGDYRYPVAGVLNDESNEGTGYRGFVCQGASIDPTKIMTGEVKPFIESIVVLYIAAVNKTFVFYGANEGGGSSESNITTVAKDLDLEISDSGTEFTAPVPGSDILAAYKDTPYNYNLIVEVHGRRDNGELYGYAANHFCYMTNEDGQFAAMCSDNIGEGISHDTQFGYNDEGWFVMYSGWYEGTGGQALPAEGSTVSIYLQKLA